MVQWGMWTETKLWHQVLGNIGIIYYLYFTFREVSFFTRMGRLSICDKQSPIFFPDSPFGCLSLTNMKTFIVPPLTKWKKFWSPPFQRQIPPPFHIDKFLFHVVYSTTSTDMYHWDIPKLRGLALIRVGERWGYSFKCFLEDRFHDMMESYHLP